MRMCDVDVINYDEPKTFGEYICDRAVVIGDRVIPVSNYDSTEDLTVWNYKVIPLFDNDNNFILVKDLYEPERTTTLINYVTPDNWKITGVSMQSAANYNDVTDHCFSVICRAFPEMYRTVSTPLYLYIMNETTGETKVVTFKTNNETKKCIPIITSLSKNYSGRTDNRYIPKHNGKRFLSNIKIKGDAIVIMKACPIDGKPIIIGRYFCNGLSMKNQILFANDFDSASELIKGMPKSRLIFLGFNYVETTSLRNITTTLGGR